MSENAARLETFDDWREEDRAESKAEEAAELAWFAQSLANVPGVPTHSGKTACVERLDAKAIFAARAPVQWVCEALEIAPGAPTLLAGLGFSGKTMLAQDLALAVATGGLVWSAFPVRKGRVVHIDYEQGGSLDADRYRRLALGRGIGPDEIGDRLEIAVMPSDYVDGPNAEEWLTAEAKGATLMIIDSFVSGASSPFLKARSAGAIVAG